MNEAQSALRPPNFQNSRRAFERERYSFLLFAHRLIEYIEWAVALDFLEKSAFDHVLSFKSTVKYLRDKNEHVVEYFSGTVGEPKQWWHEADGGSSDASATIGSLIGGRLDWNEVTEAVETLLSQLPQNYFPTERVL